MADSRMHVTPDTTSAVFKTIEIMAGVIKELASPPPRRFHPYWPHPYKYTPISSSSLSQQHQNTRVSRWNIFD
nr:6095_t:CDS:2 [Entrophospora candida]